MRAEVASAASASKLEPQALQPKPEDLALAQPGLDESPVPLPRQAAEIALVEVNLAGEQREHLQVERAPSCGMPKRS